MESEDILDLKSSAPRSVRVQVPPWPHFDMSIKTLLKAKEVTAKDAAKVLGVSSASLSNWANGVCPCPQDKMDKLVHWLSTIPTPDRPSVSAIFSTMKTKGIKRSAAARAVGVTPAALVHWSRGDKRPTLEHLKALKDWVDNRPIDALYYCSMCREVVGQRDSGSSYICDKGHLNKG